MIHKPHGDGTAIAIAIAVTAAAATATAHCRSHGRVQSWNLFSLFITYLQGYRSVLGRGGGDYRVTHLYDLVSRRPFLS